MNQPKDFISRFKFHTTPFTCEIPVSERFIHQLYEEQLEHLQRAVDKRMCASLIAPAGTGKTFLLRSLTDRLPETRYRIHYVKVTDLSKRDMCREIVATIGAEPAGTYPALVHRLQDRLASYLDIDGLRPVLILDEAHDIRLDVLGILRILTNFDMDSRLVVSILLSGQPPLAKLLRHPKLEDVAWRLAHCATLRLLSRKEITQYIQHRCQIAGVSSCPFDNGAMEALYEIGRGNFRATDHLALKALEIAHDDNCDIVDAKHVTQARGLLWP
jgi:type II secretory pathway predicted ATPase ExeA